MNKVLKPIMPNEETRRNLGLVHYHLACLHGLGRFPEIVPPHVSSDEEESPPAHHDAYSVLFHLCHASSLRNAKSCLALARIKSGLSTSVSNLLPTIVSVDFDGAKDLLQRAMEEESSTTKTTSSVRVNSEIGTKAAASCLYIQLLEDENEHEAHDCTMAKTSDSSMIDLLEKSIALLKSAQEQKEADLGASTMNDGGGEQQHQNIKGNSEYHVGDRVEANYACEGTFYPATVTEVSAETEIVAVQYDDDGSTENLTLEHVRLIINQHKAATAINADCAMLDSMENTDEKCLFELYQLKAKLAHLKTKVGEFMLASQLYEEAANGAMENGKMQTATQYSLKATELREKM